MDYWMNVQPQQSKTVSLWSCGVIYLDVICIYPVLQWLSLIVLTKKKTLQSPYTHKRVCITCEDIIYWFTLSKMPKPKPYSK